MNAGWMCRPAFSICYRAENVKNMRTPGECLRGVSQIVLPSAIVYHIVGMCVIGRNLNHFPDDERGVRAKKKEGCDYKTRNPDFFLTHNTLKTSKRHHEK